MLDITRLQNRTLDELIYEDTISLDNNLYKETDIIRLSPINVHAVIRRITDSSYNMMLNIKGTMVLPCSITLKEVDYPFDINTEVKLSNDDEDFDEYVKIMQNNIDIISIIWQNIVLEIPLRVVSEDIDDSLTSGDGWKLIREE
jgi:uncharacterized protein